MPKKTVKRTSRKSASKPPVSRLDAKREQVRERVDGWMSILSGVGTAKDKRTYATYQAEPTNWVENLELWRGDDLAGRIVEAIPDEMMREGWELCVEGDGGADIAKEVMGLLEDHDVNSKLWHALCAERALGGAGMLVGANDARDFSQPLSVDQITSLNFIEVFEPSELTVYRWQNDPQKRGFGLPVMYRLNPMSPGGSKSYGLAIHESRLIVFPGIKVSRRQVTSQKGWGDAVLTRCRETLRDFQTTWAAAGLLAADFSQAVWKIKGLAEIVALDKTNDVANRIAMMELARSIVRATVIDADGEEFERKQTPITGLPELLDRFATRLAASADMPVTRLMGMSPAGLNATGESDIRTWYDRIRAQQYRKLRPAIEKLVRVAFAVLGIDEPEDWSIRFKPLWQPTELEQAQARFTQMQTDTGYVDHGVLSPDVVRNERFGQREYSFNTHIDPDTYVDTSQLEQNPEGDDEELDEETPPEPKEPTPKEKLDPTDEPPPDDEAVVSRTENLGQERRDMVERRGDKWLVLTEDGSRVLGTHDTEEEAQAQLGAIERAKKERR